MLRAKSCANRAPREVSQIATLFTPNDARMHKRRGFYHEMNRSCAAAITRDAITPEETLQQVLWQAQVVATRDSPACWMRADDDVKRKSRGKKTRLQKKFEPFTA
jgi:hypothetical protein